MKERNVASRGRTLQRKRCSSSPLSRHPPPFPHVLRFLSSRPPRLYLTPPSISLACHQHLALWSEFVVHLSEHWHEGRADSDGLGGAPTPCASSTPKWTVERKAPAVYAPAVVGGGLARDRHDACTAALVVRCAERGSSNAPQRGERNYRSERPRHAPAGVLA